MKDTAAIQYVLDEQGNTTAVIVPIELWRELQSERETAYLLKSNAMKQRLIEAKNHQEGIPFEAVRAKLRI
jgi:predicted RNA polymerase sigma factor